MRPSTLLLAAAAGLAASPTLAWTTTTTPSRSRSTTVLSAELNRRQALESAAAAFLVSSAAGSFWAPAKAIAAEASTLPNGVAVTVQKKGDGPKPDVGELVAIRFAASYGEQKIDDIFDTPEPYYTRIGSGALLKGVEETLPLMRVGDRWLLTIPGSLAFGPKGRPSSPGKPRIPGDATITFDVEMVGLPGKEPELIELIGDF